MNFKKLMLNIFVIPLAVLLRITGPVCSILGRIYYRACLIAKTGIWDTGIQCDGTVLISGTKNIRIGKRCRLGADVELRTVEEGNITLGDDIRINRGCTITSYSKISIGDFTIIGEYSSIRDANHGMAKDAPMRYQPHTSLPIEIGRDVWIGRGACVLPGVSIGNGSIIGANSVVTKDIPGGVVAAGVPAVIIRER